MDIKRKEKLENYVLKVNHFYTNNKLKLGFLEFDKKENRFVIRNTAGKIVKILTCGDIFIVEVNQSEWHIGQCEKSGLWLMMGTGLTQELTFAHRILYHPTKKIRREMVESVWLSSNDILGPLPKSIVKKMYSQIEF
jgi:hypothetical protein